MRSVEELTELMEQKRAIMDNTRNELRELNHEREVQLEVKRLEEESTNPARQEAMRIILGPTSVESTMKVNGE